MARGRVLQVVGRWVGVTVCLALVPAWIVFTDRALRLENGLQMRTIVLIGVFLLLALVGAIASWRQAVGLMFTVAMISFVPVGFYFLLNPEIARLIGVLYVVLLLAVGAAWAGRRAAARSSEPSE